MGRKRGEEKCWLLKKRHLCLLREKKKRTEGEGRDTTFPHFGIDESLKYMTDCTPLFMCLGKWIGGRLGYTCGRKNSNKIPETQIRGLLKVIVLWLPGPRPLFSRTNQSLTQEAELWAPAAAAAEPGDKALGDAGTTGIRGSMQNASIMLQASIKEQSGDDNLMK